MFLSDWLSKWIDSSASSTIIIGSRDKMIVLCNVLIEFSHWWKYVSFGVIARMTRHLSHCKFPSRQDDHACRHHKHRDEFVSRLRPSIISDRKAIISSNCQYPHRSRIHSRRKASDRRGCHNNRYLVDSWNSNTSKKLKIVQWNEWRWFLSSCSACVRLLSAFSQSTRTFPVQIFDYYHPKMITFCMWRKSNALPEIGFILHRTSRLNRFIYHAERKQSSSRAFERLTSFNIWMKSTSLDRHDSFYSSRVVVCFV